MDIFGRQFHSQVTNVVLRGFPYVDLWVFFFFLIALKYMVQQNSYWTNQSINPKLMIILFLYMKKVVASQEGHIVFDTRP